MSGHPPLIVIGMHRSGTSMVMRLLDTLGVFAGWRLDRNHEAVFFQRLNDWVLRQSGASWDSPEPVRYLLQDKEMRDVITRCLDRLVRSPRAASYLGPRRFLASRTPFNLEGPWGFKDPRTTYTLPLWLELFPDARVLHVCRHGVDVAESLRTRHARSVAGALAGGLTGGQVLSRAKWRNPAGLLRAAYVGSAAWVDLPMFWRFASSVRCATLDGGLALWEAYVTEAARNMAAVGERGMTVRYEDLLDEPARTLAAVVRFCGLDIAPERLAAAVTTVRGDRAFAYRRDAALQQFARRMEPRLSLHGYREPGEGR